MLISIYSLSACQTVFSPCLSFFSLPLLLLLTSLFFSSSSSFLFRFLWPSLCCWCAWSLFLSQTTLAFSSRMYSYERAVWRLPSVGRTTTTGECERESISKGRSTKKKRRRRRKEEKDRLTWLVCLSLNQDTLSALILFFSFSFSFFFFFLFLILILGSCCWSFRPFSSFVHSFPSSRQQSRGPLCSLPLPRSDREVPR